ncbi:MAG: T9SS C-terminal target domain-containing protein [Bacteroidetes bacterium]|nr:MAG: T9SS C-terminal target domain-containing protein [Bacteroidota bacterium]
MNSYHIHMKRIVPFFVFLFLAGVAQGQSLLDTVRIKQTAVEAGTPISTDDAEQLNDAIDKLFDDDLDMGWEGDEFNIVTTGLVFRGINVPQGATIDSAFLEIFAHEAEGDPAYITIYGEAADSAITYNNTDLITARPSTQDSIRWEITEDWAIWTPHRSPNLKGIIQEVVSRSGWKPGNALNLIFAGEDQGASSQDNARDFEAFENIADPDDGGDGLNHPERIPKLYIYYRTTTSIGANIDNQPFTLTPNPVSGDKVSLQFPKSPVSELGIGLWSLSGQEIRNWQMLSGQEITLDVQTIPAGVYLLQVTGAQGTSVRKLVIL